VIGVVNADGTVGYIRDRLEASSAFLEAAAEVGPPELRYRFSAPCQQSACGQWHDGCCTLPGRLAALVPSEEQRGDDDRLPRCAIRARCRWFAQSGADACGICPVVGTRDQAVPVPDDAPRRHAGRPPAHLEERP